MYNFDEYPFEGLKDELEEILRISDFTPYHLQQETMGPRINETYRKLRLEKSSTNGEIIFLMGYARSPYRDFESYLRIVVGLDEDDIQLIWNKIIQILSPKNYPQAFTQLKIKQRLFTRWEILKQPQKLVKMTSPWTANFFELVLVELLER